MKFKWAINMIIAAPMILICSVILAGGGHGFPDQLFVLFPLTFISKFIDSQIIFLFFGLVQYPIYGLLYDISNQKKKTVCKIVIFHFLIVSGILISKYR
jgi:uncharacterized membrane protein YesL